MKIIVLAGGLSPERDVSLISGAGICRTLRERGHHAFLLDVFFGYPCNPEDLEKVFDLPDGGLKIAEGIKTTTPDLESRPPRLTLRPCASLVRISPTAIWAPM